MAGGVPALRAAAHRTPALQATRPPVPLKPWGGVADATKDGARCPEAEYSNQTSEDCLFLNVYTTKLPGSTGNPKRPVMIFLHPGAFYLLRGTSDVFGPQYLLDEDIVLVTLNYRLGALGFLSTGDSILPGNNGFKDQVLALRWVQQNIASFGGDPHNVTLSGYSAGSTSVYLHMLSPMSKGLFHKGIAMSAGFQSSAVKDPLQQAKKQARILNCPDTTSEEIVECLKGKSAKEIAETQPKFFEFGWDPMIIFGVVIEEDFGDGAERFMTADPTEQLLSGDFAQVPLIAGTTKDEFTWKGLEITYNNLAENMSENYEKVFPIAFVYERDTPHSLEVSRELKKFYLQDKPITNDSEKALGQAYSDALIIFPTDRAAKIVAQLSSAPVYYYHFTYAGRYSWLYSPGTQTPYGVSHHDDLIYLFYISVLFPEFVKTDPEYSTVKKMTKMWSNFIKTGNPTPEKTGLLNVEWTPLDLSKPAYLEIGSDLSMRQGLYYQERMQLWDKLFPLPARTSRPSSTRVGPLWKHQSHHAHHH
uniref:Carboxylic ester hydrolase n=1 Tax=Locusta migratoria TaxID=7004 RepID=W8EA86_LOCMI|nr:carboxylesterase [Locusta migratoria]